MKTICLGFSHPTAPIQLREQLYYPPAALQTALARFGCGHDAHSPGVAELAILSTCNRVELYAAVEDGTDGQAQFDALLNFVCETRHMRRSAISGHAYRYGAREALQHLCRVAAGLDSPVLGEPQILGQVAAAHAVARGQGAAGPLLAALFRTAIRAGKRARAETAISRNPASVGSLAAQRAAQVVEELAEASVLVVGAGEMGVRAAEALRSHGVRRIGVANRTQRRAAELAQRWGGRAYSFEQLAQALAAADIVITATGAPHPLIDRALVAAASAARRGRGLIFIDIAVPRDVDPGVGELPGVQLVDIDDLQAGLQNSLAERQREVPQVEAIIAEEVQAFQERRRQRAVLPVIKEMRHKAEVIRRRELARTFRNLPGLDSSAREQIERLSQSLVNKLLHAPTVRLRGEATNGRAGEYVEAVRELFDLGVDESPAGDWPEPRAR